MELHVTGEFEARLAISAAKQGRKPEEIVRDVLTQYLEVLEAAKSGVNEAKVELNGQEKTSKIPVLHLGEMGPLHRRDIYDNVR